MPADLQSELDAILHRAAFAVLNDRAFLRITGSDATRWLNGMVTNSIQALTPGEGNYNFLLNAQGRIQADCTIYREPDGNQTAFLLETDNWQLKTVQKHLDHFIIMDDVELTPVAQFGITVIGPEAFEMLTRLQGLTEQLVAAARPSPPGMYQSRLLGKDAITLIPPLPIHQTYEVWFPTETQAESLREQLLAAGATEVSAEALEALRLLEATPLYGRDITERYLPQETNQPHALHFNKGCYLGQEIVERIRSRGQVHRLLTPLTLTGSLPTELPTPLQADSKPVGEITSAALVPFPEGLQLLALGYLRREALEGPQATHMPLTYSGGTATSRAASKPEPTLITNH